MKIVIPDNWTIESVVQKNHNPTSYEMVVKRLDKSFPDVVIVSDTINSCLSKVQSAIVSMQEALTQIKLILESFWNPEKYKVEAEYNKDEIYFCVKFKETESYIVEIFFNLDNKNVSVLYADTANMSCNDFESEYECFDFSNYNFVEFENFMNDSIQKYKNHCSRRLLEINRFVRLHYSKNASGQSDFSKV